MTAAAIVPTHGQGFLKSTVKGFVCLMAVILTLSVPVALFVWQFFDFQNENALSQEWFRVWGKVFGGYVAGVATLFVVSQMFWRLLENAFAFFRKKTWIGPYSLVWILLSVAPLTNFWHIVNQPYLLHTNEGQVRLMDDGRVFYAGSAVEVPRFSISSTTVPLDIFAEGDYSGNWNPAPVFADTPSGRIYLVLNANFELRGGEALTTLLQSADYDEVRNNERRFFETRASAYLGEVSNTLVSELQAGKFIPNYTVRLTQLIDRDPNRPAWLGRITVSGVKVGSGESNLD